MADVSVSILAIVHCWVVESVQWSLEWSYFHFSIINFLLCLSRLSLCLYSHLQSDCRHIYIYSIQTQNSLLRYLQTSLQQTQLFLVILRHNLPVLLVCLVYFFARKIDSENESWRPNTIFLQCFHFESQKSEEIFFLCLKWREFHYRILTLSSFVS